jgi:hypothetical protein
MSGELKTESRWRRLIGVVTVIIAASPILSYALGMAESYDFAPSVSEFIWQGDRVMPLFKISLVSSILCFFWGLLIYRRFRPWAWECFISAILALLAKLCLGPI